MHAFSTWLVKIWSVSLLHWNVTYTVSQKGERRAWQETQPWLSWCITFWHRPQFLMHNPSLRETWRRDFKWDPGGFLLRWRQLARTTSGGQDVVLKRSSGDPVLQLKFKKPSLADSLEISSHPKYRNKAKKRNLCALGKDRKPSHLKSIKVVFIKVSDPGTQGCIPIFNSYFGTVSLP